MSTAICPGSFDPITMGHINVIERAAGIFDEVIVCIMVNTSKKAPMFTTEERVAMASKACKKYKNVRIETFSGLLAEYAKKYPGCVIVKGLRAVSDFEYEFQMSHINKSINTQLETMFLTADQKYTFLSSSLVKEMLLYGGSLKGLVPDELIDDILRKGKEQK